MEKGFTAPVISQATLTTLPKDIVIAREKLKERRKLALILKSKALKELPVHVRDLVEIYQQRQHEKSEKWSITKPLLSINHEERSVMVPGNNNKVLTVAIEDLRPATPEENLAQTVQ